MNKSIDEYLQYIYYSGRDLTKIYNILASLNKNDDYYEWLDTNIVNTQRDIKNDYVSNGNSYVFTYESWLGLNVKNNKTDSEFFDDIANKAIKIYVSLDKNRIKEITSDIFKFLSDNNVECQSKIGNVLRTDALTIRVCNKEDVSKVIYYINGMDYTPNMHPNPFLLECGKVSIARDDGFSSYNQVLSDYISDYFYHNMSYNDNHNDWREVSSDGFAKFLEKKLDYINKNENPDLYMVTDIIYRNIVGDLKLDDIVNYNVKEINNNYSHRSDDNKQNNVDKSTEYILLVEKLKNHYENNRDYMINERHEVFDSGIDYAHAVIEAYIKTGRIEYFDEKLSGIRSFAQKNFDVFSMRETVNNIGYNCIIEATKETINKYNSSVNITGNGNEKGVIERLLYGDDKLENDSSVFTMFTNNKEVRSRLGYFISPSMARSVLISKLDIDPNHYKPTYDELMKDINDISDIILEEVDVAKS